MEPALRPARIALAGDTAIGDSLPRCRPTFAGRSNRVLVSAVAFVFANGGRDAGQPCSKLPVRSRCSGVVIGCALALGFAVPIFIAVGSAPSMQPIRDLADRNRTGCRGQLQSTPARGSRP